MDVIHTIHVALRNSPLDFITLECASCNSARGLRLVRYAAPRPERTRFSEALGLEAITLRSEAIATRVEGIAPRVESMKRERPGGVSVGGNALNMRI